MSTVLLIEDDARLADYTRQFLERQGMTVTVAPDGETALAVHGSQPFEIVLLDLGLPGLDGLEVCRRLRAQAPTPLIMVTARDDVRDRVVGLELGADDYLTKPFEPTELVARIRAVLRRDRHVAQRLFAGGLALDLESREVTRDGARIDLTSQEFDLLAVLARHAGRPLTREQLLDALGGGRGEDVFDRAIDVCMSRLRQKIEENPRKPRLLKTIRGVGYLLAPQ